MEIDVIGSGYTPQPTLPGADYYSQEAFEVERQKIFFARWLSVGREELVTGAGSLIIAEVGGESLIITRDEVGRLDRLLHNFKQRYLAIRDGERSHR